MDSQNLISNRDFRLSGALHYLKFKVFKRYVYTRISLSQLQEPKLKSLLSYKNQFGGYLSKQANNGFDYAEPFSNNNSLFLKNLAQEFPTRDFEN